MKSMKEERGRLCLSFYSQRRSMGVLEDEVGVIIRIPTKIRKKYFANMSIMFEFIQFFVD